MTTDNVRLALAIVDATLDNAVDLDAGVTWTNLEVVAMLEDIRSLLLVGQVIPGTWSKECPQPCIHLSQQDAREGKTCAEHPCTCTPDREVGSPDADQ